MVSPEASTTGQAVQRLTAPKPAASAVKAPAPQPAARVAAIAATVTVLEAASTASQAELKPLQAAVKAHPNDPAFWNEVVRQVAAKQGINTLMSVLRSKSLPRDLKAALKLALLGGEAELTYAAFINQLAFLSYDNTPDQSSAKGIAATGTPASTASSAHAILAAAGYRALPPIQGLWGFQMQVFMPVAGARKSKTADDRYTKTIVAFRGTEGLAFNPAARVKIDSGKAAQQENESNQDTMADLVPYATAYSQYEANSKLIVDPLLKRLGGDLVATGHSLGGGLAQIAVAKHAAQFSELYTFQGASIKKEDVDRIDRLNPKLKARHFRMNADFVPSSGEQAVNGEVYDVWRNAPGSVVKIVPDPYVPSMLTMKSGDISVPDKLNNAGGHNTPIAIELLRDAQVAGLLGKNNALAQALTTHGSQDPATLNGQPAQVELDATYPTKIGQKLVDRKPGQEGAKQSFTGTEWHGQFVDTYKNNAIYNILMEHAMPQLLKLKFESNTSDFISDLEDVNKKVLAQHIAHTASSKLMLNAIFNPYVKEIALLRTKVAKRESYIEQLELQVETGAVDQMSVRQMRLDLEQDKVLVNEYDQCKDLNFNSDILKENRNRFESNLIDVWYSLHLGSDKTYLDVAPEWKRRHAQ